MDSSVLICTALAGWFARWISWARNMSSMNGRANRASTSATVQSWRKAGVSFIGLPYLLIRMRFPAVAGAPGRRDSGHVRDPRSHCQPTAPSEVDGTQGLGTAHRGNPVSPALHAVRI